MSFNCVCTLFLNDQKETWICHIEPLMPFDCTEYIVEAHGSRFHLVIGEHEYSKYIYIPTWNLSMDISYLSDRYWNQEQLRRNYPELSLIDVKSIVEALVAIEKQHQ